MLQIGPYQVLKELARGGMGVVYLAQGPAGEQVAVKLVLDAGLGDAEQLKRFAREAQALETLDHPGILRVRSHGVDRGRPFMVMDLLPGPTLADVVREEGALPAARVTRYGRAMAAALAHAHSRGVVHRDLKPANVILRGDDPVLVDFGLVRLTGHDVSRLTQSGTIMGSPAYMPPEQADGLRDIGPGADIYGLGATLYCLLTGRPPFEGTGVMGILKQVLMNDPVPPSRLRPGVDPALERVILRCMEKEPSQRFPSAAALEQALAKLAAPARRSRRAPLQRASKPSPLRPALLGLLTGVPALLLGAWFVFGRGESEPAPNEQTDTEQVEQQPPQDPATSRTPHPEAQRLVRQARDHGNAERYQEALAVLDEALLLDPNYALAYATRGLAKHRLERHVEAIADLDRALELAPTSETYAKRGSIKRALGRAEEALEDFDRALELDPSYQGALVDRSHVALDLERHEEALRDLNKLLRINPNDAKIHASRGSALLKLERFEDAIEAYTQAIDHGFANPLAYNSRGKAKASLGRLEAALEDYGEALRRDPSYAHAYLDRGRVRLGLGRLERAIEDFTQVLRLDPENFDSYSHRALANAESGRFEQAIADYTQALELNPRHAPALVARAAAKANLGLYVEAIEDCDRCLQLDSTHAGALATRGKAKVNLGRLADAKQDFEQALRLDPQSASHHLSLAMTLTRLERYDEATTSFNLALRHDPSLVDARLELGKVLVKLERQDEALQAFDEALRLHPADPRAHYYRGALRTVNQRYAEALADFDRALELNPSAELRAQIQARRKIALERVPASPSAGRELQRLLKEGLQDANAGRDTEALAKFDRALSLEPKLPKVHALRGRILMGLGRHEEAIAAYDQVQRLGGSDGNAYRNRGVAYFSLGRNEEALADYDRALRLDPNNAGLRLNRAKALVALERYSEGVEELDRALELGLQPEEARRVRQFRAETAAKLRE